MYEPLSDDVQQTNPGSSSENSSQSPIMSSPFFETSGSSVSIYEIKKKIEAYDLQWIEENITSEVISQQGYLLLDIAIENKTIDIAFHFLKHGALISTNAVLKAVKKKWLLLLETYIARYPNNRYLEPEFLGSVIAALYGTLGADANRIVSSLMHKADPERSQEAINSLARFSSISSDVLRVYLECGFKVNNNVLINVKTAEAMDMLLDFDAPASSTVVSLAAAAGWDNQLQRLIAMNVPIPETALARANQLSTIQILMNNHAPYNSVTLSSIVKLGDINRVQLYIDYGVSPSKSTNCIAEAIWNIHDMHHRQNMITFLLNAGVSLGEVDMLAAFGLNDLPFLKLLAFKGGLEGNYCLRFIDSNTDEQIIDFLISISKPLEEIEQTAIASLPEGRALKYMQTLIERGTQPAPLCLWHCIGNNNLALMQYLISLGVSIERISLDQDTNRRMVAFFLEHPDLHIKLDLSFLKREDIASLPVLEYICRGVIAQYPLLRFFITPDRLGFLIDELNQIDDFNLIYSLSSIKDNIVPLLGAIFLGQLHYKISISDLILHIMPASMAYWQRVFPAFIVPSELEQLSPWGFNPEEYQRILLLTEEAAKKESDLNPVINAYNFTVLFGSLESVQEYLKKFNNKARPVHDACLFNLPKSGLWDIESWRNLIIKNHYPFKIMRLLAMASVIEQHLNGPFPSHKLVQRMIRNNSNAQQRKLTLPEYYQWKIHQRLKTHSRYGVELSSLEQEINQTKKDRGEHRNQRIKQLNHRIKELLWNAIKEELLPSEASFYLQYKQTKGVLPNGGAAALVVDFFRFYAGYRQLENKSSNDFIQALVHHVYRDVPEQHKEFAFDCAAAGFTLDELNKAITILDKGEKPFCYIPKVTISGDLLGHPGFIFTTLSTEPNVFVLGMLTRCCQNLNGISGACVLHGAEQSFGGFVKITKEHSINPWVAQSWVGLTADNELVFDSIERLGFYDPKMILDFYALAATLMLVKNPGIKRVLFGGGGNTPTEHGFPLQEKTNGSYPEIIGFEDGAYDSKYSRYILAEQGKLNKKHLKILSDMGLLPDGQNGAPEKELYVLAQGTDTCVNIDEKQHGVSMNQVARRAFFERHPRIETRLKANKHNPLLEEGFYVHPEKRERVGGVLYYF